MKPSAPGGLLPPTRAFISSSHSEGVPWGTASNSNLPRTSRIPTRFTCRWISWTISGTSAELLMQLHACRGRLTYRSEWLAQEEAGRCQNQRGRVLRFAPVPQVHTGGARREARSVVALDATQRRTRVHLPPPPRCTA